MVLTSGAAIVTVGILGLFMLNLYMVPVGSACQRSMVKSKLMPLLSAGIQPV